MASFFPRLSIGILTASTAAIALWAEAGEPRFPWQETHARVLSHGDLEWDPRPFAFEAGDSVRYIDFENGDDANDGRTPARAWKHHPWDADAEANAATGRRVDTYVFRRGVVYRGQLVAPESGEPGNPIRLTSDPRWGEGEAAIHGSKRISGGWRRLDPATAPAGMPEPRRVWVRKLTMDALPTAVWELHQDQIIRIHLARTPNWTISDPDDVRAEWAQWRHVEADEAEPRYLPEPQVGPHRSWGIDPELLTETDPDAYAGATVWTEYAGLMGTPYPNRIEAFDPERNAIRFAAPWSGNRRPVRSCRYFLENHPRFLDEPGEYWFDADSKRLYLRLPEDRDPNEAIIEVARHVTLIDIRGQSHIHISGLTFRFQRVPQWYHRFWDIADEDPAGVKVLGSAEDIRIANNRFEHIVRAIWIQGEGADSRIDNIAVTDNEIRHADWDAIDIRPGREGPQLGHLGRVSVLRNFIHDSGSRPRRAAHGHTLNVQYAQLLHVAGNILERTYGAGIMLWGGKPGGVIDDVPLVRMLVHHNKVVDSLLHTNDWGGIETWQGGPAYLFSNISVNPGGYWHYLDQVTDANWDSWWDEMGRLYPTEDFPYFSQIRSVSGGWTRGAGRNHASARFGFAFFMDGAFKQYLFNNIAVGKSNDIHSPLCNTAAISSVANGFLHGVFQNTFHHFGASSYRGPGAAPNHFVGNIFSEAGDLYIRHARPTGDFIPDEVEVVAGDVLRESYAQNVVYGDPRHFGVFERGGYTYPDLQSFARGLARYQPIESSVGIEARTHPLRDPDGGDFRPGDESAAIGAGARFFVPWGLSGVVGEWQFRHAKGEPDRVLGEHWYMAPGYLSRDMYTRLPRHDLRAANVSGTDYVQGSLEDWTNSALELDGRERFLVLADEDLRTDVRWGEGEDELLAGEQRRTMDMDRNNFLIEAVLRVEEGEQGVIVSKARESGYVLDVHRGLLRMQLLVGGEVVAERGSRDRVDDGRWRHVVAEVDRAADDGIRLYVDGEQADGAWSGRMPAPEKSLSNRGDFLVGRGEAGHFLRCTLDFLRVARSTLSDSKTCIEELWAWQFDGPASRDFAGREVDEGRRRDAGALSAR